MHLRARRLFLLLTHLPLLLLQSIVQQFLVLLMTSTDESLHFLSFRLDFNEHYKYNSSRCKTNRNTVEIRGHVDVC